MSNLWVEEEVFNATKFVCENTYETFTGNKAELFRRCLREFGKCVGCIYTDNPDDTTRKIGWVFQKAMKYTDTKEPYVQEVWVTVLKSKPVSTVSVEYEYA